MQARVRRQLRYLVWLTAAAWTCAAQGSSAPQAAQAQRELDSALQAKPDADRGRSLFDTCAACHQSSGAGAVDGTVPALAGQHFRFIVQELVRFRYQQRSDERMHHFTDQHHLKDAQQIADVAAYISRLPATHSLGQGSGAATAQGAQLYASSCATCHGASGEGDGQRGYPRLAGQHYQYLIHVLFDAADMARPDFARTHEQLLQGAKRSDLTAVADYLSRLGP